VKKKKNHGISEQVMNIRWRSNKVNEDPGDWGDISEPANKYECLGSLKLNVLLA